MKSHTPPVKRIGIVNRGEPAVRFLAAVEALHGDDAVEAVALYTDADAGADWITRADAAVRIGAGRAAYLDAETVIDGLERGGCDAAWLGWGFASEDGAFAGALEAAQITILGPRPETMIALGDKIKAKALAEAHDVPVAPWAVVEDAAAAAREAGRIGFPLLIKAAGGGGGRGIRRVDGPGEVAAAFVSARDEAARSFGGGGVFLERLVRRARHVEVQVLGDGEGDVRVFGVRDCSLQRRRQKVIEECPGPPLPAAVEERVTTAARRLCAAVRYRGVGTVEFLYDLDADAAWFLEVNTRLQVEHTVTEAVYRVDLVKAQIDVARGRPLPAVGAAHGHAVEARVCAEDTRRGFTPAPGRLVRFAVPTGPGLRVDTGFVEGEAISAEFDPLVAKLIAWGPDRPTALARLRAALGRARIVVEGGASNLVFLRDLLAVPAVVEGAVDIGLVDRWRRPPARDRGVALLAAAIDRFLAHGDRAAGPERHRVEAGETVRVYRIGRDRFRVQGADGAVSVRYAADGAFEHRLSIGGQSWRIERAEGDTRYLVDGEPHDVPAARGGAIGAPSAALVLDSLVQIGDVVEAGAPVAILESMKMEVRVEAPCAGTVREVCVGAGDQVTAGQLLVVIEPSGAAQTMAQSPIPWSDDAEGRAERVQAAFAGWDADPGALRDAGHIRPAACLPLLATFADIAELFDRRPSAGETAAGGPSEAITTDVWLDTVELRGPERLSPDRALRLGRALAHHGVDLDREGAPLADALMRLRRAGAALGTTRRVAEALLGRLDGLDPDGAARLDVRLLDRLADLDPELFPRVVDAAQRVRSIRVERPARARLLARALDEARRLLDGLRTAAGPDWAAVDAASESLVPGLAPAAALEGCVRAAEAVARRLESYAGGPDCAAIRLADRPAFRFGDGPDSVICVTATPAEVPGLIAAARPGGCGRLDLVLVSPDPSRMPDATLQGLVDTLARPFDPPPCDLCLVAVGPHPTAVRWIGADGVERDARRDVLPSSARRLDLDRLVGFHLERLESPPDVVLLKAQHTIQRDDVRLLAYGEIRSLERTPGIPLRLTHVERVFHGAVRAMDYALGRIDPRRRLQWNRITLRVVPPVPFLEDEIAAYIERLSHAVLRIGLEKVVLRARVYDRDGDRADAMLREMVITRRPGGRKLDIAPLRTPSTLPLAPLDHYLLRLVAARRRGLTPPDEMIALLQSADMPPCRFEPFALDDAGDYDPAPARGRGQNPAGVVFGIAHGLEGPHGQTPSRVLLMSDPTRSMGSLAEAECRRIIAALDLAEERRLPLEWIAVSAGARIDWESGTENLDWTAATLRRIVRFTQGGGEINVLVPGICVGAQSYFNAEATMMMHTRGVLIMTDRGSMVLTGKRALDASGCVSADDDLALGGYTAIMGPNGQAQAHADDLEGAWRLLYRYYGLTWVAPGARRPARVETADPVERDITRSPYPAALGHGFATVGEIFSARHNPDRKRPFAVRPVMGALVDRDHPPLERWAAMHEAETVVVWEARIGGCAATVIGVDNQPLGRLGRPDPAGPEQFAGGTLYPQGARKLARALNAASGRRPAVVLANLSGFDGSPESLRRWQLEYGAEIGRAVVNFDGPIVFVVLSRYHGGAYVVFSKRLNPRLTALALDGSYASVIGGAPAAAVVFAGEVRKRAAALGGDAAARTRATAELAARFDGIHTVERARAVGSIDRIIGPGRLRAEIAALLAADLQG